MDMIWKYCRVVIGKGFGHNVMVESNNQFTDICEFMDYKNYLHVFNNYYNAIFIDKLSKYNTSLNNIVWQL